MAPIIFMDTETTGLSLHDDIWEFAAVRREDDGSEKSLHMFIKHAEWKREGLPLSFREDIEKRFRKDLAFHPSEAAFLIGDFFKGTPKPHIVGAVPNFDTERLALLLGQYNIPTNWHYHLIDVETLAIGYLARRAELGDLDAGLAMGLPWNSDELSNALGVDASKFERHTAMGDVRWTMANFDRVMARIRRYAC